MLKAKQQQLYELLEKEKRCFVRICDSDDALWVTDLPRKTEKLSDVEKQLLLSGFCCRLDTASRLWYVDPTEAQWEELLKRYPDKIPSMPEDERYHAAYALCRLYLLHPAPLSVCALPAVRRMLKLTMQPEEKLLQKLAVLHGEAAVQLRMGQPVAHAAGRILAGWLNERSHHL